MGGSFSQSSDSYMYCRGPTELVQHFAYRGISYQRKGAARDEIDMILLYCPPFPGGGGGLFYLSITFLPAFAAPSGREGVSTVKFLQSILLCEIVEI